MVVMTLVEPTIRWHTGINARRKGIGTDSGHPAQLESGKGGSMLFFFLMGNWEKTHRHTQKFIKQKKTKTKNKNKNEKKTRYTYCKEKNTMARKFFTRLGLWFFFIFPLRKWLIQT
jgi:hypothetical protein